MFIIVVWYSYNMIGVVGLIHIFNLRFYYYDIICYFGLSHAAFGAVSREHMK